MRHARQRQSQVCGVHGRASSGFGQQVHVRPLSNPEPGGMVISPGRRVFRRLTKPHRPWPGCRAPTNPPSRRARPSRSRMARAHRTPRRERLPGTVWVRPATRRCDSRPRPLPRFPLGHQVGVRPRPYVCALTRQVWPVDQAISPSPRSGRDVAGANRRAMSTAARSRAGHAGSCALPWSRWARTAQQFAMARRGWP